MQARCVDQGLKIYFKKIYLAHPKMNVKFQQSLKAWTIWGRLNYANVLELFSFVGWKHPLKHWRGPRPVNECMLNTALVTLWYTIGHDWPSAFSAEFQAGWGSIEKKNINLTVTPFCSTVPPIQMQSSWIEAIINQSMYDLDGWFSQAFLCL